MTTIQKDRYADLLIWSIGGVDGRCVAVMTEPVHRDFAVRVARRAYALGARLVTIDYADPLLVRARVELAREEDLDTHPGFARVTSEEYAGPQWSVIRIVGSAEPDYLEGMDPDRVARYARSAREVGMPLSETVSRFRKHWVGALLPTVALAERSYPDSEPEDALARYEAEIVRILALDDEDPAAVWAERFRALSERRDRLNALDFDELLLSGPGTDLRIGLLPGTRWATAEAVMPDGRTAYVNMPSLEVFTTPDLRRTSGRVRATRPYLSTSSPGTLIRGAWFEFRDGAVADFGAETGQEALAGVLELDEQARYLGEIALVDSQSAVATSDITFFNTLYDENAAIHMALGRGFPRLVNGAQELAPAELIELGVNHSLVHDDVMIGSREISVDGVTRAGETVPVMREGCFVEE